MATAPVKPQQLHNFPISLKWGQTTTPAATTSNNHRHNRSTSTNNRLTTALANDSETESDPEPSQSAIRPPPPPPHPPRVGSRSARVHRFSFTSCSTLLPKVKTEIPEKPQQKLENNNNKNEAEELEEGEEVEEEDSSSRRWKLRPRKGILSGSTFHVNEQKDNTTTQCHHQQQQPKSMRLRGLVESSTSGLGLGTGIGNGGVSNEKKEKRKFWIALSREEIEEDVFALTGSRPNRRPKKRPKNVQKALDSVFPGLWLVGTTADSYRVADPPVKR